MNILLACIVLGGRCTLFGKISAVYLHRCSMCCSYSLGMSTQYRVTREYFRGVCKNKYWELEKNIHKLVIRLL